MKLKSEQIKIFAGITMSVLALSLATSASFFSERTAKQSEVVEQSIYDLVSVSNSYDKEKNNHRQKADVAVLNLLYTPVENEERKNLIDDCNQFMDKKVAEENKERLYADDREYANFSGRLYIPSAGIDVALYRGLEHSIVERADSAAIHSKSLSSTSSTKSCVLIEDLNSQTFANLENVKVGAAGSVKNADGKVVKIRCVASYKGLGDKNELTDLNNQSVLFNSAYYIFTGSSEEGYVYITQWDLS